MAGCVWLLAAVLVFSTRGGRELPCAPHARTLGCLAIFSSIFFFHGVYSSRYVHGQGATGQTRHGWTQDELGPLQRQLRAREAHAGRAHEGWRARETRTAGPVGLSVVATGQAGLQMPASRPHVSAVCKDRPHMGPRSNVAVALFPLALCVRAWHHSGDPRRVLGHGGPTRAGELMEKCRGSLRLCPGA